MSIHRRELLKMMAAAPLAINLNDASNANPFLQVNPNRKLSMRFAHITDTHLLPERNAPEKFAKCLHHIHTLSEKPDFIFCGGDLIMDALSQERARVQEQWDLWHSIIRNECSLSLEYCIGNHDIWGLEKAKDDPMYAKKYATEMMKLDHP